jgi:hypothetical protein
MILQKYHFLTVFFYIFLDGGGLEMKYSLCQNQITTNTAFYPENQPATLST